MNCDDVQDRLDDHVDGLLAPNEAREVQAHLRECADCAEEDRLLRALSRKPLPCPRAEPSVPLAGDAQRSVGQVVSFAAGSAPCASPGSWPRRRRPSWPSPRPSPPWSCESGRGARIWRPLRLLRGRAEPSWGRERGRTRTGASARWTWIRTRLRGREVEHAGRSRTIRRGIGAHPETVAVVRKLRV
jgi:anti-sigma factor RsiW